MGLLKKEKNYNWKCVDVKEVEKISDTSEYPSELVIIKYSITHAKQTKDIFVVLL